MTIKTLFGPKNFEVNKKNLVDESLVDFMEAERNASEDQYALALAELDKVTLSAFSLLFVFKTLSRH